MSLDPAATVQIGGRNLDRQLLAGLTLMAAAALGIVLANSPLQGWHADLFGLQVTATIGGVGVDKPLLLWVNDGLMALFFLLVALEIKRELVTGALSRPGALQWPLACAIGGVVVPVAIYLMLNAGDAEAQQGWAIPAATDIAFALGLLAMLGSRVPTGLKVLLSTIAVVDDLIAIVIIALFYSSDLTASALFVAAMLVAVLIAFNRFRVMALTPYLVIGLVIWFAVLQSGVHATLAGVVVGLLIPLAHPTEQHHRPLDRLESALEPWVMWLILPVFAFANAGVDLRDLSVDAFLHPVPLGIALGLLAGKPIGILAGAAMVRFVGRRPWPAGMGWPEMAGVGLLCGVGFTMSFFISSLAFEHGAAQYQLSNRLGILAGSLAAGVAGVAVLARVLRRP